MVRYVRALKEQLRITAVAGYLHFLTESLNRTRAWAFLHQLISSLIPGQSSAVIVHLSQIQKHGAPSIISNAAA